MSRPLFPSDRFPIAKRLFDLAFLLITAPVTVTLAVLICGILLVREGGPIFYRARRSGQGGRLFSALKFRTMRAVAENEDNSGVSGGNKSLRISPFSAFLRKTRLDELPQLLNVLWGDMTLVGPRPPDPTYVDRFPEVYADVLRSRPGLTGLATLHMHRFEDRVLRNCTTAEETDTVYCRRCIPRKARLDRIYRDRIARRGAVCFDLTIIAQSIRSVLR